MATAYLALFVGLDNYDEKVQVCALNEAGDVVLNCRCENSAAKIQAAVRARSHASGGDRIVLRRGGWCTIRQSAVARGAERTPTYMG